MSRRDLIFLPSTISFRLLVVLVLLLASGQLTTGSAVVPAPSKFALSNSSRSNKIVTLPLQPRPPRASKGLTHPAVVHQQHINRGWSRLALMTNRPRPTKKDLLSRLHHRLSFLPQDYKTYYSFEDITQLLQLPGAILGHPPVTTRLSIQANDIGYMANINMGTPARQFKLLVDSGSADFWVGEDGCQGDDGGGCGSHHHFIGANSSRTFKAPDPDDMDDSMWVIGYVSGLVSGYIAQDIVSIGGLLMRDFQFGVALNESADFTAEYIPFDGIAGFATSLVSRQNVPTLLDALYSRKLIDQPIVSFRLPRVRDGKDDGEMTLGGLDSRVYQLSTLIRTPNVNPYGFWGAQVDRVFVGNITLDDATRTVVFDTGTTLLIIPEGDARAIHSAIPGAVYTGGGWTIPCQTNTTIVIIIEGQPFPIEPRDLTFAPVDPDYPRGMCMSGIGVGGVGPFFLEHEWLAGAVFLKNVYFSADESTNKISLAKLRD